MRSVLGQLQQLRGEAQGSALQFRGQFDARQAWAGIRARAPVVAPSLIALAALTVIWTRLIVINQGLWGDEAYSVAVYIRPGPGGIWAASTWLPNDHTLFELLTWATTGIIGTRIEAAYRLWGVFPAMAAWVVMTWWLWRRFDRWTAAVFAVLATVSPLFFDLGTQARGYGIGFLAGALLVIAADWSVRTQSPKALALLAGAGVVGILTLLDFAFAFVGVVGVLMLVPAIRRRTLIVAVGVGVIALIWYSPLLSTIVSYKQPHGQVPPWSGFLTGAVNDQLGSGINLLDPAVSTTAGSIIAGVILAGGMIVLWRRGERILIGLLIAPAFFTYLIAELGGLRFATRFGSFAMLPLLALGAVAIAGIRPVLGRRPALIGVALVLLAAGSFVAMGRFVHYASGYARVPFESANVLGTIVRDTTPIAPIVSNAVNQPIISYLAPRSIRAGRIGAAGPFDALLNRVFCSDRRNFLYIETAFAARPDTACLLRRGSLRISLPERRSQLWLWVVPAVVAPSLAAAPAATRAAPAQRAGKRSRGRGSAASGTGTTSGANSRGSPRRARRRK